MFPLSASPKCVALRSKHDNSYLRTVHDESHGNNVVELSGSTDDGGVMNPRSRFYLEPSKEHDGLIHVRCCYNNKYWVPQQCVVNGSAGWIIGTADEPEEDLSKTSCTLFKPVPIAGEDDSSTRFLHSQLGKYASLLSSSDKSICPYMHIAHEEADQENNPIDAFTVIDVSEQKQLPKYLVFKGDNGKYLGEFDIIQVQFGMDDIGDPTVVQTISTNHDGVVRISDYRDLFWRRDAGMNWIFTDDKKDTTWNNPDTLFRVITGDDFIALQNLGNNNFCRRLQIDDGIDSLCADSGSITHEAKIQCYEPLLSRRIYDVDFRLNEARTYTTDVEGLTSQTVKNDSSTTVTTKVVFTYTNTVTSSWSSTVSMKLGIQIEIESGVPLIAEGKITVSAEFEGSYTWGETKTEEKQISREIEVTVPPMKKMTIKSIGSNGVCDIPYSYKQSDVLLNGKEVTQVFTDGMYRGVKTSDITFETKEEPL